ncbi:glutaredoxin [Vibrio harveyi]|uniref:glutaredoxin 3 n=1 Tax=Vibrio harveyi TaxID=669 RepID=UPI0003F669BB|nr:glutaredoxin 3 [Vibrio harveyi]AWA98357.1 glutaredoxin 3 [Vibrio harveyi]EKO3839565.1 glutaredoxin 3 [Vibrio harveyi]ELI6426312.1 glutaredoxin 3 [Vibrio harveyi]ELY1989309.1 glutaredoxin 3 [Vibrio harveyi]RCR62565.1 glutaredoxin 3 [Vibrio harveyi]
MAKIEIYTKHYCPHCKAAKHTLKRLGLTYREIEVSDNPTRLNEMKNRSQRQTVPQIFVGNHHVGGNDDLVASIRNGDFEQILECQGITHTAK